MKYRWGPEYWAAKFEANHIPEPNSGCWLWLGPWAGDQGYGSLGETTVINVNPGAKRRCMLAHRYAYEQAKGPIPGGLEIDHKCRVRSCVNPDHLEAVTGRVNTLRSMGITALNARKTHCAAGHPFDEENTRYRPDGARACRACARIRARASYRTGETE